jgi:hypothetical protein
VEVSLAFVSVDLHGPCPLVIRHDPSRRIGRLIDKDPPPMGSLCV